MNSFSGLLDTTHIGTPTEIPNETSIQDIRRWASGRHIPIIEFDPRLIDTTRFSGRYIPWVEIPLSNYLGWPLLIGDLNRNGRLEVYGMHETFNGTYSTRIYEVDKAGGVELVHQYGQFLGRALMFRDLDENGLMEVIFARGDSISVYEQETADGLPMRPWFRFAMWEYPGTAIYTQVKMADLNDDSQMDFLYRGSEYDTTRPSGFRYGTYISEFDTALQNFRHIWSTQILPIESGIGGYDVGDYDGDGLMEFIASGWQGQVWVYEHKDSDDFELTFYDSLPFIHQYYQTSGDVDQDGRREFFVGATMSSGNWTTMYEADGNDQFSPRIILHMVSGGSADVPTYYTVDANGDGRTELLVSSGNCIFFFRSDADDHYELAYFKQEDSRESVAIEDLDGDGIKDLLVSKSEYDTLGRSRFVAHAYLGTPLATIGQTAPALTARTHTLDVFPSPFNSTASISFHLDQTEEVHLKVVSILGQVVAVLLREEMPAGQHAVSWTPADLASGVYFVHLTAGPRTALGKVVYIR